MDNRGSLGYSFFIFGAIGLQTLVMILRGDIPSEAVVTLHAVVLLTIMMLCIYDVESK